MILTPHAIIGASVANLFPNEPIVGVVLAYTSHYILDMLPHKDYSISNFYNKETEKLSSIFKSRGAANNFLLIMLDVMVAIVLCSIIFIKDEKSAFITLLGVVGGLLPDFLQLLYFKYKNSTFIFFKKSTIYLVVI